MRGTSGRIAIGAVMGMAMGALAAPAQAMCSAGSPPIVAALQQLISDDPARALRAIDARLAAPGLNRIDRAWLHAAQALAG